MALYVNEQSQNQNFSSGRGLNEILPVERGLSDVSEIIGEPFVGEEDIGDIN